MRVSIDLSTIRSLRELHMEIAHQANFPEYYGANLDALYDVLTESGDLHFVFWHRDQLDDALRCGFDAIVEAIVEASEENDGIRCSVYSEGYELEEDNE